MMLRKSLFALSAVLLLGATAACGDDDGDKKPGDVSCEDDPTQDKCDNGEPTCAEDPTQDKCEEPPVVVEPTFCEIEENKDSDDCKRDHAREEVVHSYVNDLAFPEDEEGCCWDFLGKTGTDKPENYQNALVGILPLLGALGLEDFDLDELIEDLLADGDLSLLLEFKDLPEPLTEKGALDIALFLSSSDSDWADRSAGDGVFTKEGDAVATISGRMHRETVIAEAGEFPLTLDISGFAAPGELEDLGIPTEITLKLINVHLNLFEPEDDARGLITSIYNDEDEITTDKGKAVNYLTGVITGNELVNLLNDIVGDGMCDVGPVLHFSAVDKTEPAETEGYFEPSVTIVDGVEDKLKAHDSELCQQIGDFADLIGMLAGFFDVDTTDNQVLDSLSLGLHLGVTGAEVVE